MIIVPVLILLILLSAFFSSAETALTSVNPISLKALSAEGNRRADTVLQVLENYSKMLSTILICNNIVNITASALMTFFVISRFGVNFVSVGTVLLTVLILLFGEITPKNFAKIHAESYSLIVSPVLAKLMVLLTPVIVVIDKLAGALLKLLGADASAQKRITERELKSYVDAGQEEGILENDEKKFIMNVFDFGDLVAKDIMIPRIDMTCVSAEATYEEIREVFRRDMFTRLPVYRDDPDNLIGLINIKDFILMADSAAFRISQILREPFFTYEYKKIGDLMKELQRGTQSVAFVLNEYGAATGMVTMEDIIEEIVGEIRDEYDEEEKEQIRKYDALTYLVEGSMKLDDINEAIGSSFFSEDYDSIGGLMIEQSDRLPLNDEVVTLADGTSLQAKGIRQNRIVKVLIRFREAPGEVTVSPEPAETAGESVS